MQNVNNGCSTLSWTTPFLLCWWEYFFSGSWIMSITPVPSPFECCSYATENSLYSKCSHGSGNQHHFPCRRSAGARVGTWISWQGSPGMFPGKPLSLAGGGASQTPLWEMPCGNSDFGEGQSFDFCFSSFWAPTDAVSAAGLLFGSGQSLVVWQLQSLEWALPASYTMVLGEKDSPAPDKCPWG